MRITSRAGNFIMTVQDVTVENDELVMTGKMGVWSAKTLLNAEELEAMLSEIQVSGKAMRFLARHMMRHGASRVTRLVTAPFRKSAQTPTDTGAESKGADASKPEQHQ